MRSNLLSKITTRSWSSRSCLKTHDHLPSRLEFAGGFLELGQRLQLQLPARCKKGILDEVAADNMLVKEPHRTVQIQTRRRVCGDLDFGMQNASRVAHFWEAVGDERNNDSMLKKLFGVQTNECDRSSSATGCTGFQNRIRFRAGAQDRLSTADLPILSHQIIKAKS